jgi:hypothetical protein
LIIDVAASGANGIASISVVKAGLLPIDRTSSPPPHQSNADLIDQRSLILRSQTMSAQMFTEQC